MCVWPAQATPCDGSSEIFPIPKEDYKCPGQGFFVDPENCRWFFACLDHLGDGTFTHYEFRYLCIYIKLERYADKMREILLKIGWLLVLYLVCVLCQSAQLNQTVTKVL